MRRVFNALLAVIALLLATHSALPVSAGSAYNTNFITSITYQNVGSATANIVFTFYPTSGGTPISVKRTLPANAGASLNVGSTSELSSFLGQGSAVISSDQPIVATVVQLPQDPSVRNRPLSNGFGRNDGSDNVLIATVLKKTFNQTTKFSIQNADTTGVTVTLQFFPVGSATSAYTETFSLGVGTARFFDAGIISGLGNNFNGSATIQATGKVVATAIEAATDTSRVSAFEGVAQGSNTVYMPSALCDFGNTQQQRSAYAVQNTSTTDSATVTVTYKDTGNNTVATQTATIAANAKHSFQTCDAPNILHPFSGSATITSSGAPIVAIGKVFSSNSAYAALGTAFVGASAGARTLAAPYVRWTQTRFDTNPGNRQRAYIAIQNVGSGASGRITVKYYDVKGNLVGTHEINSINSGQKTNSNPFAATPAAGKSKEEVLAEFGYIGGYGGSATIECAGTDCQIVAVVRIASANSATDPADIVAEDYNAIPIN